ncbi:MAG: mannitol dehydrogenase family protein [Cyanobacteria bacterium REEB67]|nr:mannitol dehydrogenase family protein [Cyanobacteria bacterium REEB67]
MSGESADQSPAKKTVAPTAQHVSKALLKAGPSLYQIPGYNREAITVGIMHIGVGGFHRSHQALYIDDLLQKHNEKDWAICGVGIMPQDAAMHKALSLQDCLYTLVEQDNNSASARLIGSLTEYIFGYENPALVFERMADPNIKIVSLTATEGGYCFNQSTGALELNHPGIQHDLKNPGSPRTIFGYLAGGLEQRRRAGMPPFTVLSCDNLQGNGHVIRRTLTAFCREISLELARFVETHVSFPNCMVDRITPATTDAQRQYIQDHYGLIDAYPVVSEPFKQWVIEDHFSQGRPPLELVGVQFTNDVAPYEKMKIRLLNATHSAMGYLGYLCGYRYIYEIAQAKEFQPYLQKLMDLEVTPLVPAVPGVNLSDYKGSLMERFSNENIKDQALRICMDGSSKLPKFILPSIKEELERGGPITRLTLCIASWMRFLTGVDEDDQPIPIDDPLAEKLKALALASKTDPRPFLAMTEIFGDLGDNKRFVDELTDLLESLYEKGARATLDEIGSLG